MTIDLSSRRRATAASVSEIVAALEIRTPSLHNQTASTEKLLLRSSGRTMQGRGGDYETEVVAVLDRE